MHLRKHDLLQMDDEWLKKLPAELLLEVSKRLLHDVKELQDRLNRNPTNSSCPLTPAQALMIIVPKDEAVEVEAFVENKDIGFVNPGQEAVVKIETFPFTKYGTIEARVTHVSNDAVSDEKRGLIFPARVNLQRATIQVENKTVNLSPGMAVTVEVKTAQRRVIEYFLSPLMQYKDESLRER